MPRGAQNAGHPGFVAADEPYDCAKCVAWHADRFQFPQLDEANARAWEMYLLIQDQVIAGGMEIIGLDYKVLQFLFDTYEVPMSERRDLFEKIVGINQAMSAHRSGKREMMERTKLAQQQIKAGGGR